MMKCDGRSKRRRLRRRCVRRGVGNNLLFYGKLAMSPDLAEIFYRVTWSSSPSPSLRRPNDASITKTKNSQQIPEICEEFEVSVMCPSPAEDYCTVALLSRSEGQPLLLWWSLCDWINAERKNHICVLYHRINIAKQITTVTSIWEINIMIRIPQWLSLPHVYICRYFS